MNAKAKAVKVENYSAEVSAKIKADFLAGVESGKAVKAVVEELAVKYGKTPRSIVAKASRDGYYVKDAAAPKISVEGKAVTKAELVEKIAAKLGVASVVIESLEAATKQALSTVLKGFDSEVETVGVQFTKE